MNEHLNHDAPQHTMSDVRPASSLQSTPPPLPPKPKKKGSFLLELFKFAFIAIVVVLPIRFFVAQPFIVSGASMQPTFEHGEYLIVDELSYRFTEPERGDVIIFRFPADPSKFFIKRIVGLPDETVIMDAGVVTVRNDTHPGGLVLDEPYVVEQANDAYAVHLASDEYFVLGDNRTASSDSRVWGPLDEGLIIGRALLRLLPVARAAVLPGAHEVTVTE